MKLLAAGCSLTYGSELPDERPEMNGYSHLTFSALLGKHYNLEYLCCATPGNGNDAIARQTITDCNPDEISLAVINWTYFDRFEFYFDDQGWQHISTQAGEDSKNPAIQRINPYRRAFYADLTPEYSRYQYLKDILLVQEFFKDYNIPYVFSSMAENMLDADSFTKLGAAHKKFYDLIDFSKWVSWPDSYSFMNWAIKNKFPLGPGRHPLEHAHRTAFEFYKQHINSTWPGFAC